MDSLVGLVIVLGLVLSPAPPPDNDNKNNQNKKNVPELIDIHTQNSSKFVNCYGWHAAGDGV